MRGYGIYDIRRNHNTRNWNGEEWVVDGERGIWTLPGTLTKEEAMQRYRYGIIESDQTTTNER